MRRYLPLALLTALLGCEDPVASAGIAMAEADYALAAELWTQAAVAAGCPERGTYLLRRAEAYELDGQGALGLQSIDKAIEHCPDLDDGWWARAQRAQEAGDRAQAMADARQIKDSNPDAAALFSELSAEVDLERAVRERAGKLVADLKAALDFEAKDAKIEVADPPRMTRQVPIPMNVRYAVRETVRSPQKFELDWEQSWSYRGDPSEGSYNVIYSIKAPPLENHLPLYYRLSMSNLQLPMRFGVDARGNVVNAAWMRNGPNRGMRPQMLQPEIEGMLKRRRLYDPGKEGVRVPGDAWKGEDVRVVDGGAVEVTYASEAVAWVQVLGVRTLHIRTKVTGKGFTSNEESWIHPETGVEVRWTRHARYQIRSDTSADAWDEIKSGQLISVSGGD